MIRQQRNTAKDDRLWQDLVTHDGVFAVNAQQRIVYWSPTAERLLGRRSEEVLGRHCYEVLGGQDSLNFRFCRRNCPVFLNARRGRPTPDYDVHCTLSNGEKKWINVSILLRKAQKGNLSILHVFRDVSRRRQVEEFARKVSSALRDFTREDSENPAEEIGRGATPLPKLSRRELQVLRLLASGMTTEQIASTLSVQPITARNHISRVIARLGVDNRLQAVVFASEHGLL